MVGCVQVLGIRACRTSLIYCKQTRFPAVPTGGGARTNRRRNTDKQGLWRTPQRRRISSRPQRPWEACAETSQPSVDRTSVNRGA